MKSLSIKSDRDMPCLGDVGVRALHQVDRGVSVTDSTAIIRAAFCG